MLNSRSVAKLMSIKQKIRGEHPPAKPEPEPVLIDNKPASAVYDELNEHRIQSRSTLQKDLAR